jgi:predicted amidophosphoribosyltransferase
MSDTWKHHECPRCASTAEVHEGFCWMCGWDMRVKADICDRCGLVIEEGSSCESCIPDPTAGWGDWHPPNEEEDE